MAIEELKEAIRLREIPSLWIPGIIGGILGAMLWILYNITGTFFTGRLIIIFGLIILLFITGLLTIIKNREGGPSALLKGGIQNFFRVLLPQLVIIFTIVLLFLFVTVTLSIIGLVPDAETFTVIFLAIGIPGFVLTFFFDTAAVFEDRPVFDSIKRSIELVLAQTGEVIIFFLISIGLFCGIVFSLAIVWEALLFERLQPLTTYNQTQIQSFTPDQLFAMIGPSGLWVTALIIFIGVTVLLPLLYSYKACVFRKLTGKIVSVKQVVGEYDSKGRWYKY